MIPLASFEILSFLRSWNPRSGPRCEPCTHVPCSQTLAADKLVQKWWFCPQKLALICVECSKMHIPNPFVLGMIWVNGVIFTIKINCTISSVKQKKWNIYQWKKKKEYISLKKYLLPTWDFINCFEVHKYKKLMKPKSNSENWINHQDSWSEKIKINLCLLNSVSCNDPSKVNF